MFQKTFTLPGTQISPELTAALRSHIPDPSKALMLLSVEDFNREHLQQLMDEMNRALPGVIVCGLTTNILEAHHDLSGLSNPLEGAETAVTFSLLTFEHASFQLVVSDLSTTGERAAAAQVRTALAGTASPKGILVFSSGLEMDIQLYLDKVQQGCPGLPLFGTRAAPRLGTDGRPFSFLLANGQVYEQAVLSLILSGEHLQIQADALFGWTPLGKHMTVTRVHGNVVEEIDGAPAVDIYSRYLALSPSQITALNTCEFPLIRTSGQRVTPRVTLGTAGSGGVICGGQIRKGDEISFSYGTPEEILSQSDRQAENLAPFGAQSLMLIICGNRSILMGEDQEREIESFKKVYPCPLVLFGNSELFQDAQGGGEMNSSLVYVAMRETDAPNVEWHCCRPVEHDTASLSADSSETVPLARRLLTFLNVTSRELESLEANLESEVAEKTAQVIRQEQDIRTLYRQLVLSLSNAIDAKDNYTNGHSRRVAEYAREIARRYGYDEDALENIYMIGLLHDVGKIGVPDEIINKPGRLTDEEFDVIRQHPAIGAQILTGFPEIACGAHWHHERYDGRGYPDHLAGENIPELAQIISVADAYDAMTSNRSYRQVMPQEKVRSEIEKGRGTQFSPRFADIMLEMIDEDTGYRMRGNPPSADARSEARAES